MGGRAKGGSGAGSGAAARARVTAWAAVAAGCGPPPAGSRTGHPASWKTGVPVRMARAISLRVPQLPPIAMTASATVTTRALRISPWPVGSSTVR